MTISNICNKIGTAMVGVAVPGFVIGSYLDYKAEKSANDSFGGVKLIGIFIQGVSGATGITGLGLKVGSKVVPRIYQKVSTAANQYWKNK